MRQVENDELYYLEKGKKCHHRDDMTIGCEREMKKEGFEKSLGDK